MPRIEGPEKKGIKRKKRRRAWASMDDILNSVEQGDKNLDASPEASGEATSKDPAPLSPSTQNSEIDQPRKAGPSVPSSNREQTENNNSDHSKQTKNTNQEHIPSSITENNDPVIPEHKQGTNQDQKPGTDQDHKLETVTGYKNREQSSKRSVDKEAEGAGDDLAQDNQEQIPETNQAHELGTNQEQDKQALVKELVNKVEQFGRKQESINQEQTGNKIPEQIQTSETAMKDGASQTTSHDNLSASVINEEPRQRPNQEQTENKLGTNQEQDSEQTLVTTENKSGTDREQTGIVPGTFPVQNSVQNQEQIHTKTENKISEQIQAQQGFENIETLEETYYLEQKILSLSGHAENCFRYISQRCFQNNQEPFETTYGFVSKSLEIQIETLKTTLKRLKKKNLITNQTLRMGGPAARRMLGIPKPVLAAYSKLLLHQKGSLETGYKPGTETENKLGSKPGSKLGSSASSKLVSNNKLLTREGESDPSSDKPSFSEIDISSLNTLGITSKHLRDMENQRLELTAHQVEDLIARFGVYASDPSNMHNVRNKAAIFIRMAQMMAKGEDPLPDVKTEEDELIEAFIAKKLEQRKRRQELEKQAFDMEFEDWIETVDTSRKDEIAPPTAVVTSGSEAQVMMLKNWFKENLWPDRKREILGESTS